MPSSTPTRVRPRRALALLVVGALGLAACSSDDPDDAAPSTTAVTTTSAAADRGSGDTGPDGGGTGDGGSTTVGSGYEPTDGPGRLAAACNAATDVRSASVTEAAREAAVEGLGVSLRGELPPEAELDRWADALDAYRGQLADVRLALSETTVPADEAADWDVVVHAGDALIEALYRRADALQSHDLAVIARDIRPGDGEIDPALEDALVALGVDRSDCVAVFTGLGVPEEHRAFVTAAADACTAVVSRRRAADFETTGDTILGALADVIEDDAVDPARLPELGDAVDVALAEWRATHEDLAAVDPADAPEPALWEQAIAVAEDRIAGFEQRAAAVASADPQELVAAFTPSEAFTIPGFEDFAALGLAGRDCDRITA